MKKRSFKVIGGLLVLAILVSDIGLAAPAWASAVTAAVSVSGNNEAEPEQPESGGTKPEVERKLTYHDVEDPVPVLSAYEETVYADRNNLPGRFSSVDTGQVTPLRDQGIYGTCWAFAAVGASEAGLISQGIAGSDIDLSERQLAYYFYQKGSVGDLLGGTTGDYNLPLTSNYMNQGGNSLFTIWHLASWAGLADESRAPYAGLTTALSKTAADVYGSDTYHLQNAYIINKENTDTIKQMIMEYGSMAISYYSSDSSVYDNPEHDCYYYYGGTSTNHAVQVVGWDDTFSRDNFATAPEGDGAWLIKNSWGEESNSCAQDGYFWISYYDTSISNNFFAYICEKADNYDNIYQYDGASGYAYISASHAANVYTAKANEDGIEKIEAVGIGNWDNGINYTVDIYTDLADTSDPTSGTKALSQSGTLAYSGYHTIPLNRPVYVGEGETFSVVFSFDSEVKLCVDYTHSNGGWIQFQTGETAGTSFYKYAGKAWIDAVDQGDFTFRVKAYTSDALPEENGQLQGIALDQSTLALDIGSTAKLQISYKPYYTTVDKTVTWTSSNANVASVDSAGKITGKSAGTAVITAACQGKTAKCTVTVRAAKVSVQNVNNEAGTFTVRAERLNETAGVSRVQFAVWSAENGQDDLVWYTANPAGSGVYTQNINIKNHGAAAGNYVIHAYVYDGAGNARLWGATECTFTKTAMSAQSLTAKVSADEESATITASGVFGVQSLRFAVWSNVNGQDDLVWYPAANKGNGTWSAVVPVSKHHYAAGSYQVHAYGQNLYDSGRLLKNTVFQISGPQLSGVAVKNTNNGAGTFTVEASGVAAKAGISSVQVAVWSKADQSNLKWYTAVRQSNGAYTASVNIADHDYQYGVYTVHVYVTDQNGNRVVKSASVTLTQPAAVLSVAGNGNQTQFAVKASGVAYAGGVKSVRAAVWSENGGQDDLVWYLLKNNGNGVYSTNVPVSAHKTAGTYQVHLYIEDARGGLHLGKTAAFKVDAPAIGSVSATNIRRENGSFQIEIRGIAAKSGISKVEVAVWSAANQSNLRWYTATRQSDGTYIVPVNITNHNYQYGNYTAHVYLTDGNGVRVIKGTTVGIAQPASVVTAIGNANGTQFSIKASNVNYAGGVKNVRVAVWSQIGGQDDLRWYSMKSGGNGIWSTNVPVAYHNSTGNYEAHVYVDDAGGNPHLIGNTRFYVTFP